jgi:hypothetical protein
LRRSFDGRMRCQRHDAAAIDAPDETGHHRPPAPDGEEATPPDVGVHEAKDLTPASPVAGRLAVAAQQLELTEDVISKWSTTAADLGPLMDYVRAVAGHGQDLAARMSYFLANADPSPVGAREARADVEVCLSHVDDLFYAAHTLARQTQEYLEKLHLGGP